MIKKLYCVICGKYRKFRNPKISYIFEKQIVLLFGASERIKMKKEEIKNSWLNWK